MTAWIWVLLGFNLGWLVRHWIERKWAPKPPPPATIFGLEIDLNQPVDGCRVCALRRTLIRGGAFVSAPQHDCPEAVPEVLQ